jgi:hypothetical protein
MKKIAFKILAHAVLLTLLSSYAAGQPGTVSQEPPPPPPPAPAVDAGTITDSTYVNDYFGMRMTIPEGWNVYDAQGKRMIMESGRKQITAGDKKIQDGLDASIARTVNLLTASKLPQNEAGPGNAIFACGAEPVPRSVIKTGEDYLIRMKQLFKYSKETPQVEQDISSEKINGADFGVLTLRFESPGVTVRQKYWVIPKRDYALFCVSTYTNEADRLLMNKAMSSIKFQ